MKNIYTKMRIFIATLIAVLAPAVIVYAALNTLNGQNGAAQTFATSTDSNISISVTSASNVHTFSPGWSGVLPVSRGGTGTSTWITGSIPFFNGPRLTEDSGIKYDYSDWGYASSQKVLILGRGQGQAVIQGAFGDANNQNGGTITLIAGSAQTGSVGNGGGVNIFGGDAGSDGNSGDVQIGPGRGGYTSGNGGTLYLQGGEAANSEAFGGDVVLQSGGSAGNGGTGHVKIGDNTSGRFAILDVHDVSSSDKTFYFPNQDGTFALLQGAATSTIKIGDIKSCIVMADSDGDGVTYVTANDGVLTATTTQPSNCQ